MKPSIDSMFVVIKNNMRDHSPTRKITPLTLIIVTAIKLEQCLQVYLYASSIPTEVEQSFEEVGHPIVIEKDLLDNNNQRFTNDQKNHILGFLKAIGVASTYSDSIPNYKELRKEVQFRCTSLNNIDFEANLLINRVWNFVSII